MGWLRGDVWHNFVARGRHRGEKVNGTRRGSPLVFCTLRSPRLLVLCADTSCIKVGWHTNVLVGHAFGCNTQIAVARKNFRDRLNTTSLQVPLTPLGAGLAFLAVLQASQHSGSGSTSRVMRMQNHTNPRMQVSWEFHERSSQSNLRKSRGVKACDGVSVENAEADEHSHCSGAAPRRTQHSALTVRKTWHGTTFRFRRPLRLNGCSRGQVHAVTGLGFRGIPRILGVSEYLSY